MQKKAVHPGSGGTLEISVIDIDHTERLGKRSMRSALEVFHKSFVRPVVRPETLRAFLLLVTGTALAVAALTGAALGDTLELKGGRIIQGRFVDGSPLNIRFEVDGG